MDYLFTCRRYSHHSIDASILKLKVHKNILDVDHVDFIPSFLSKVAHRVLIKYNLRYSNVIE